MKRKVSDILLNALCTIFDDYEWIYKRYVSDFKWGTTCTIFTIPHKSDLGPPTHGIGVHKALCLLHFAYNIVSKLMLNADRNVQTFPFYTAWKSNQRFPRECKYCSHWKIWKTWYGLTFKATLSRRSFQCFSLRFCAHLFSFIYEKHLNYLILTKLGTIILPFRMWKNIPIG